VPAIGPVRSPGEWGPGRGYNGAAYHANSACVFNSLDNPDPEDDFLWALTPAKGRFNPLAS
jgi:hypothetical protein